MASGAPSGWKPRTREDHMLRSYLRRLRRNGPVGAVRVEVPFGRPSGGTARRLDAVRFPPAGRTGPTATTATGSARICPEGPASTSSR